MGFSGAKLGRDADCRATEKDGSTAGLAWAAGEGPGREIDGNATGTPGKGGEWPKVGALGTELGTKGVLLIFKLCKLMIR